MLVLVKVNDVGLNEALNDQGEVEMGKGMHE